MVLSVDLYIACDNVIKRLGSLLQLLSGLLNLLLGAFDLNCDTIRAISFWNIDLSTGISSKLLHLLTASANQRSDLTLCDRDSCSVRVVNEVLVKTEQLISDLLGLRSRTSNSDLVVSLTSASPSLAGSVSDRGVITDLCRFREINP